MKPKFARKASQTAKHMTYCKNCNEPLMNMGGRPHPSTGHTFYHIRADGTSISWFAMCRLMQKEAR